MGGGSWTASNYCTYSCSVGRDYDTKTKTFKTNYKSASQAYKSRTIDKTMDPMNVVRECKDTEEHPNTIPIILALDVTGSMGDTALQVQKKLNPLMIKIYEEIKDAELMVMAIGDLAYDDYPIQISQFESDIRIAENLDKIYFESGGGGNDYESYTSAWYMGVKHCKLDCWDRGKKGLIITMGDEPINPYLPRRPLERVTGDSLQDDIETKELYKQAKEKFDIYHICVESNSYPEQDREKKTFDKILGSQNVMISSVEDISDKILSIIKDFSRNSNQSIVESFVEGNATDEDEEFIEITSSEDKTPSKDEEISW